jgi:hypothetical protein
VCVFPTRSYTYTRGRARKCVPARVRAHTRARFGVAAGAQRPAPHRRPAERARRVGCRRPKAAHTRYRLDTDAVFHAPMFALNADAEENACEPKRTRSTPTERARTIRRRCVRPNPHAHTRTRARTHMWACRLDTHASVTHSSIDVARRMDIDACMYRVDEYHKCVSHMDVRVNMDGPIKSERRTRTHAVYSRSGSTRTQTHVYASDMHVDYISDPSVAVYRGKHTYAHAWRAHTGTRGHTRTRTRTHMGARTQALLATHVRACMHLPW